MLSPPNIRFVFFVASVGNVLIASAVARADEVPQPAEAAHVEFFESKVRPVLVQHCQSCHGEAKQEYGLRLDSRAATMAGSDEGPVVVEGKPGESKLLAVVHYDGDIQMPPKGKLADEEIAALTRWIELGLPWPDDGSAKPAQPMTGDELYRHARENLWSLQPVRQPELPPVNDKSWPRRSIDHFILAKLEAAQLTPAPEADRRTLIRRATFDLLGLPPTPEEVDTFLADQSPGAWERLIDQLLASPAYGERWGRHWLDVARYADTKGYAFGKERKFPYAYTYRDWVIRAFNDDMPYDEFIRQQLAADHIPDNPPHQQAALGFLTVGRKFNNEHDDIDDQIDVVTRGLLGLTVACARCHDHKYDAIPTEDYYSLYGVFASSTEPEQRPLISTPAENEGYEKYKTELSKREQKFEAFKDGKHAELLEAARQNVTEYLVRVVTKKPEDLLAKLPFISLNADDLKPKLITRWRQYLKDNAREDHPVWKALALAEVGDDAFAAELAKRLESWQSQSDEQFNPLIRQSLIDRPPGNREELARTYGEQLLAAYDAWQKAGGNEEAKQKLEPAQHQLLHELLGEGTPTQVSRDDLTDYLVRADRNEYRKLEKEIHSHMANSPAAPPRAMSLVDKQQLHEPRVFIRGNHHRRGDRVPRQFLRVVAGDNRQPFAQGSGRMELARAIADPNNPLTPRVMVNRVWMHHFGRPLVATPSDFGIRSAPPVQQDVLDHLAADFVAHGWSLKRLHKEIMLSATYRQSSQDRPECRAKDPENDLLWKMNRRRLEFEPMRDALLAVSGNLDRTMFGRPVELFTNASLRRRSVYGFIDRQDLPNLLRAFDFASPDQSAANRPETTVPQQALFLMNSPFVIEQAKAFVGRDEINSQTEPAARIAAMYRELFTRPPTEEELAVGKTYVEQAQSDASGDDKLGPWQQYAQLLMLTNEFMFVD